MWKVLEQPAHAACWLGTCLCVPALQVSLLGRLVLSKGSQGHTTRHNRKLFPHLLSEYAYDRYRSSQRKLHATHESLCVCQCRSAFWLDWYANLGCAWLCQLT